MFLCLFTLLYVFNFVVVVVFVDDVFDMDALLGIGLGNHQRAP